MMALALPSPTTAAKTSRSPGPPPTPRTPSSTTPPSRSEPFPLSPSSFFPSDYLFHFVVLSIGSTPPLTTMRASTASTPPPAGLQMRRPPLFASAIGASVSSSAFVAPAESPTFFVLTLLAETDLFRSPSARSRKRTLPPPPSLTLIAAPPQSRRPLGYCPEAVARQNRSRTPCRTTCSPT